MTSPARLELSQGGTHKFVLDDATAAEVLPRHPSAPDPRSADELYAIVAEHFERFWQEDGHKLRATRLERVTDPAERRRIEGWLDKLDLARAHFDAKKTSGRDPAAEATYGLRLYQVRGVVAAWWAKAMGGAFLVRAFTNTFGIDWWGIYSHVSVAPTQSHSAYPVAFDDRRSYDAVRRAVASLDPAEAVAAGQILRLERAMCTRRRWPLANARTFLFDHPLVAHLARRLLWAEYSADRALVQVFRIAEDRSLAGDDDAAVDLPPGAVLGIVHPLELDDAARTHWAQRLADYEIVPPFPQLARETYAPSAGEAERAVVDRWSGVEIATARIHHLEARGWRRGLPQDAGWVWDLQKTLADGVVAELGLGGGLLASAMAESPPTQAIEPIKLTGPTGPITAGALDRIVFSELVRDIEMLRQDA